MAARERVQQGDTALRPLTLSQAWRGFVMNKRASGKSPYTLRNYHNTWNKLALFLAEEEQGDPDKLMLDELGRDFWTEFFCWLQDTEFAPGGVVGGRSAKHLSAKTIRNYHTDLSAFYTWAVERAECLSKHVLRLIERPDYERPVIEPFSETEVKALLAACEHTSTWHNGRTVSERPTGMRDRAIIMLLMSTGIRASELVNAKRRDMDLDDGTLKVFGKSRGTKPKERIVHFGRHTQRSLWRYLVEHEELAPDDPLFPSNINGDRTHLQRRSLTTLLSRLGKRAKVEGCYPHRFRHTFAVNYLRNGGDSLALKMMLGHTSLKMVDHYVKLATSDLAAIQRTADPADHWNL
jgi:integrase/recombinase XerD